MNQITAFNYILLILVSIIGIVIGHTLWYFNRTSRIRSPIMTVIQAVGLIFVLELIVMFIVSIITGQAIVSQEGLLDAMMLAMLSAPFLYYLIVKPLNNEIKQQITQVSSIVHYAMNGIVVIDEKGMIHLFNPSAEKIFGYKPDEVIGKSINMLMPAPFTSEHDNYIQKYLETGVAKILNIGPREVQGKRKDGTIFPMQLSSSNMQLDDKRMFLGIVEDISHRKQSEENLQRNYEQLQKIYSLASTINHTSDINEVYAEAINSIKGIFNADKAAILIYNENGALELKAQIGLSEHCQKIAPQFIMWKINDPDPQIIDISDVATEPTIPDNFKEVMLQEEIRALCGIPLVYHGKLLGKFMVYFNHTHEVCNVKELAPAQTITNHVSFGIARMRMEEHQQKLLRILRAMNEINQLIVKERDLTSLLDKVCKILINTRDYDLAWIGLVKPNSYEINPIAKAGSEVGYLSSFKVTWDDSEYGMGTTGIAIKTKDAVVKNADDKTIRPWFDKAKKHGFKVICSIPLIYMDKVLGVLSIYSNNEGKFDRDELGLLNELAGDISFALHNFEEEKKRELAEVELEKSNEKFQNFFYLNPEPCSLTQNGKFIYVNQAYIDLMGYTKDELLGHNVIDLNIWDNPDNRTSLLKELLLTGYITNQELKFRTKNNELLDILYSAQIIDINGEKSILSIMRDISEQKKTEKEIIKAKQAAEEANKAKSEFLANMSHEIRTPMNSIIGMADLLSETPMDTEQQEYIKIFKKSGEHLLTLINDILDLSKIEAGHIELEHIDFNLVKLVEKVESLIAVRAHEKGLELTYHIAPDVPVHLLGDSNRMNQVLINLIGNAVKFTEEGEVFIDIKKISEENDVIELLFEVRDTGIGIPAEKLDVIFHNFTQVDSSTTRKYGGTGLGLTISKRLVELMGGQIWAKSETGKGSVFSFTVKLNRSPVPNHDMDNTPIDLHGIKTLIIDDNATNRLILREYLIQWGSDFVSEVSNGKAGLAELKNAKEKGEPYHLVLLDLSMPEMDGFEVAKHIKNETSFVDMTIMMLTSNNMQGDVARSKEVGISRYLVKPIKKTDLKHAIQKALRYNKITEIVKRKARNDDTLKKNNHGVSRILLVDDSEDNRQLIELYLKKLPYEIDIAENGAIAVEKFEQNHYDLILMDVQMPVMDGYTATKVIRNYEHERNLPIIPIIALTANAFKEDEEKSLRAGCTDHLTKPVKKTLLVETLEKYLQKELIN